MKKTNVLKHPSPVPVSSARPRWVVAGPWVFIKVESTPGANSDAVGESPRAAGGQALTSGDALVPDEAATA